MIDLIIPYMMICYRSPSGKLDLQSYYNYSSDKVQELVDSYNTNGNKIIMFIQGRKK